MPPATDARRGTLLIVIAALLWSSGGVFIKLAPLPGVGVVCGRALVTTLFFLVAFRPDLRRGRLDTGICYAGMIITFVIATKLTTAANAVFLQYTGSIYVLALAPFVLRERFRGGDAVSILVCLVGMAILLGGQIGREGGAGIAIAVASGVFFALTLVFLRRDAASPGRDVMASTTLGNAIAVLVTLPFAAPSFASLTVPGALVIAYLGLVQVGVAYALFNRGLRHVPAARASLLAMLEPVMNPVWVYLGTGERPAPAALVGGAVVLGAVMARSLRP
jgi:drug/metabolite transporter (DMT)-like permease